jgi:hypothetical protein
MRAFAVRCSAVLASASLIFLTASASAQAHAVRHVPKHKVGRSTSTNWSGYAIDGSGATHVIGTWTQPKVSCAPGENSWSSPWVGIDGDNSNTVEQIGTDSDCSYGTPTYYAWYEMYPKGLVTINMPVVPGHSYTAEVKYVSGAFQMTLVDGTTGQRFTTIQNSKKARRSSVEWIMEGPVGSGLTNFGSIGFTTDSATINGQTAGLSAFGAAANPITMTSNSGTVRAQPSAVDPSSVGFGVSWVSS